MLKVPLNLLALTSATNIPDKVKVNEKDPDVADANRSLVWPQR